MKHMGAKTLASALILAASATPAAASSCRLPGGRTVAAGRVAKLVRIPTPQGTALYACIRRTGRKIPLDDNATLPRVTGRWVAWQRAERHGQWRIAVHDLRTGHERLVDGHVADASLGLTTRGTIVWAQQQDASALTPLYVNDTTAGGRLLDGGDVDAGSVRLAGRRVTWLSDGYMHSTLVR